MWIPRSVVRRAAVLTTPILLLALSSTAYATYPLFPPCTCGGTPTAIQIDVWVDPEHDLQGKGNTGLNLPGHPHEEDVTWTIANDLMPILGNAFYCALLTRVHYDTKYSPRQRAGIASGLCMNDNGDWAFGQALVSIHTNAGPPSALGTYTVYPHVKSCGAHADQFLGDMAFANDLQTGMMPQMRLAYSGACSGGLPCSQDLHICPSNSPCSQHPKTAIEEATIPAAIVEVGFQTNVCQECAMRVQPGDIALAVAAGIYNTFITPTFCALANGTASAWRPPKRQHIASPVVINASAQERPRATPARSNEVLLFGEGFEGATFPPTGWTIQTSGAPSPYSWARTTSTYYVATGTGAAFTGGGDASAKDEYLISPAVTLGAGDTGLQFGWIGNRNFSSEVDVQLLARPNGGGSWTTLWSLSSEPYGDAFAAKTKVVSLGAFAGQTIQFAFRAFGTHGADFSVDDVAVGSFQPSQPPSNDQCANAAQLPSGAFNMTGATCTATNDMDPSGDGACIGYNMDGPDVFYKFNVGVGDSLTATVHGQWGAALYVMKSCSGLPADCVAGAYFEDSDLDPEVSVVFSQAGQYFLVVDAPGGSCGEFQLSGLLHGPTAGVEPGGTLDRGLQVAPNPMSSRAEIVGSFPRATDGEARLTITDVQGRRVLQRLLPVNRGRVSWEWDRRDAGGSRTRPGIYVVELRLGGKTLRARVVVRN